MSLLFDIHPQFPPGFEYLPDFITTEEESQLITLVRSIPLHTFLFQGFEAKRKVASFGYDYSFDKRNLSEGNSIPEGFNFILRRVAEQIKIRPQLLNELLLTEYPPGAVINWHRDAPPFGIVAGISLLSDCTFRLRPQDKSKQKRSSVISFPLLRRSLYIMQGPSREEWQHSISPVKQTRYSITLRTLR